MSPVFRIISIFKYLKMQHFCQVSSEELSNASENSLRYFVFSLSVLCSRQRKVHLHKVIDKIISLDNDYSVGTIFECCDKMVSPSCLCLTLIDMIYLKEPHQ